MARTLKDYPNISLRGENIDGKIDFEHIFGRIAPVHIEIGSGKGTFLLNQAKAKPHLNFLGIEWANKYYRHCVDRIGRWSLANVRVIRTDAATFVADFIPANSVDCFHVYFPDPWPKKRHHKRRFFTTTNLAYLLRCLKPDGTIKVATDHAEYFEQIKEVIGAVREPSLQEIEFFPTAGANHNEWVGTNFERKYLKEKRQIYTLATRKML